MEQYIPKTVIVEKIDDWLDKIIKGIATIPLRGRQRADATLEYEILEKVRNFIDTIEVKEVDLDEEVDKWYNYKASKEFENVLYKDIEKCARHFFELGLNASNPITEVNLELLIRQVIDLYLEAGEHYNSVIKEERKERGSSDLVIKLLSGVIDAKELGIQYVLDKLKAKEGE